MAGGLMNNFGFPEDKNTLARETARAYVHGFANEAARSRAQKHALILRVAGALLGDERLKAAGLEAEKRGANTYVEYVPRERTADDLSERQKKFLAGVWGTYGFGIPDYKAYHDVAADIGDESLGHSVDDIRDWDFFTTAPAHQVEQLFGRASTRWNGDDLELVDTYDLPAGWNWAGKVIPGLPTEDSPDKGKIHSRISAKALGLDPRELHSTGVKYLQHKWDNLYEEMKSSGYPLDEGRVPDDVPPYLAGFFGALAALKNQWDNINSGPYKATGERGIGVWKSQKSIYTLVDGQDTREDSKGGEAGAVRADSKGGDTVRADLEGGDTGSETDVSDTAVAEQPVPQEGGPRIVVNPKVFSDKRDALCVAMNEAFRILMEVNGFEPQAEPTPAQRRFFADTAYANDELMLRRTILARICTFDTSIS